MTSAAVASVTTTMSSMAAATSRSAAPASTTAAPTGTPTSATAISARPAITAWSTLANRSAFRLIAIEVWLVVGEIGPTFDCHGRSLRRPLFSFFATAFRSTTAHLGALLFEDGFTG